MDDSTFRHAVIAVGSNIGREEHLPEAIRSLRRCGHTDVEQVSSHCRKADQLAFPKHGNSYRKVGRMRRAMIRMVV